MTQIQSEKKIFAKSGYSSLSESYIARQIASYSKHFIVYRRDNTTTALNYVTGLLSCAKNKANMQSMEEKIPDKEYHIYQHFISNSNWDYKGLNRQLADEVSQLMMSNKAKTQNPTGLIIDESSHLKKGKSSVAVARQYAGVIGKVDNCQVAVYASLCNHTLAALIDQRLYLPESWVSDQARCQKAGIPEENQKYKTKPQLALEIIDAQLASGISFDWIGGDGLYGHSTEFTRGLELRGLFYVLDTHSDERVYLQEPTIVLPPRKGNRGRMPTKLRPDQPDIRLDDYCKSLTKDDWITERVRNSTKGVIKRKVHKCEIWTWQEGDQQAVKRTLVISRNVGKNVKTKYSISNGDLEEYTHKEYAYFQTQRYWVERCFDDAKNELGMSDYQVRKWIAWQHHHSLVMLAALIILRARLDGQKEYELMSIRDARILIVISIFGTPEDYNREFENMLKRHRKRRYDIEFQKSKLKEKLKS